VAKTAKQPLFLLNPTRLNDNFAHSMQTFLSMRDLPNQPLSAQVCLRGQRSMFFATTQANLCPPKRTTQTNFAASKRTS
jgi:hypothetical protein